MKRIPVSAAILLALALTQAVPSSAAPDDGSAMKEAVTAYNIGQYKRTFDIVKPLADKGNTRAAVLLGRLYENGLGVDPDPVTAAEWYRKAAEGGSVEGMKLLSFASRTGYGAVKSNAEAFNWMQRAADAGDAEAQYNLALMLNEGKIVDANPKLAFAWALQSAKKGFGEAELFVGACYEGGIGTEKNAAEAEKWYAKAARQGFTARGSVFSRTAESGDSASGAGQNQPGTPSPRKRPPRRPVPERCRWRRPGPPRHPLRRLRAAAQERRAEITAWIRRRLSFPPRRMEVTAFRQNSRPGRRPPIRQRRAPFPSPVIRRVS